MYVFLSGLGLLVIVGLHQLLESRKVTRHDSGQIVGQVNGSRVALTLWFSGSGSVFLQRRRPAPKVEMGTSSHNDVDLSWIPQETLNQISTYSWLPARVLVTPVTSVTSAAHTPASVPHKPHPHVCAASSAPSLLSHPENQLHIVEIDSRSDFKERSGFDLLL